MLSFGNGDLVEIDATPYRALARVRGVDGDRVHVAFEQGAYLPWLEEPVQIRKVGDGPDGSFDGRILHASSSTALIELIGKTPPQSARIGFDEAERNSGQS